MAASEPCLTVAMARVLGLAVALASRLDLKEAASAFELEQVAASEPSPAVVTATGFDLEEVERVASRLVRVKVLAAVAVETERVEPGRLAVPKFRSAQTPAQSARTEESARHRGLRSQAAGNR